MISDTFLEKSALQVNDGVEQPPIINPNAVSRFKKFQQKLPSADEFVEGILSENITMLSKAITLVESSLLQHYALGQEVIERCLPYSGNSIRIGITGVPGAGKSTFIETFGKMLTTQGYKLAVLAIDPSSERSKGSILGDKTRMETLCADKNAFIRPSPSAGSLGGVARKTRESLILCEAAGFDVIFIETVGVGQSETAVHSMVDFFLLLLISGAGDELQGIKRGIMEMADLLAVTKADGENIMKAEQARILYQGAMRFLPPSESGWQPKTMTCSSRTNTGLTEIWDIINGYMKFTKANGYFKTNRLRQAKYWMYETINIYLRDNFYQNPVIKEKLTEFENAVLSDTLSSFTAAKQLFDIYSELEKVKK
ncbi:MAG: methylmalonyl Co-A mutase-associated GTPase MeaB [Prevotellaceae bacterium]|jgi:LAO/AO transport system kinase|nr:methylmalonyl Co-A mutase-associated GTPase MeaB [Prevotellaceae bacterium]